jgi:hypothetical protein
VRFLKGLLHLPPRLPAEAPPSLLMTPRTFDVVPLDLQIRFRFSCQRLGLSLDFRNQRLGHLVSDGVRPLQPGGAGGAPVETIAPHRAIPARVLFFGGPKTLAATISNFIARENRGQRFRSAGRCLQLGDVVL